MPHSWMRSLSTAKKNISSGRNWATKHYIWNQSTIRKKKNMEYLGEVLLKLRSLTPYLNSNLIFLDKYFRKEKMSMNRLSILAALVFKMLKHSMLITKLIHCTTCQADILCLRNTFVTSRRSLKNPIIISLSQSKDT